LTAPKLPLKTTVIGSNTCTPIDQILAVPLTAH
jgi:hypothetical protein